MASSSPSLSVIVPIYNDVELIEASIAAIESFLKQHFEDFEIIMIESGSTDGADAVCDRLTRPDGSIKVIHEGTRRGFGSAVRIGYGAASKDLIILITVDLFFPFEAISRALPLFDTYDAVLSYRAKDPRTFFRRFQSAVFNSLVRKLLGVRVRHVNSGFKMIRRSVLQSFPLESNGWLIDGEIIYRLTRQNIRYTEIPVDLIDRTEGKSSVSLMTPFRVLLDLVKFLKNTIYGM